MDNMVYKFDLISGWWKFDTFELVIYLATSEKLAGLRDDNMSLNLKLSFDNLLKSPPSDRMGFG
jgi:hypothetical protein